MMDFTIQQLFPGFVLNDRNGYAMARAIEQALRILCETVQNGLDIWQDVEKMPEWRLDEMAWELGCLYDYGASVETKRNWIRNATPHYAVLGTPQAIYNYLEGFFDSVDIEEFWQYGAEPFHFRVIISGEWTEDNEAWLHRAIAAGKNVRSIFDSATVRTVATLSLGGGIGACVTQMLQLSDEANTGC